MLRHLRQLFLLHHLGEISSDVAMLRTLGRTWGWTTSASASCSSRPTSSTARARLPYREARPGPVGHQGRPRRPASAPARPGQGHAAASRPLGGRSRGAPAAPGEGGRAAQKAVLEPAAARRRRAAPAAAAPQPVQEAAGEPEEGRTAEPSGAEGDEEAPRAPAPASRRLPRPYPPTHPASDPTVPAGTPADTLTLERVQRAWELVLQRVQASSVALYGLLHGGQANTPRRRPYYGRPGVEASPQEGRRVQQPGRARPRRRGGPRPHLSLGFEPPAGSRSRRRSQARS